MVTLTRPAFSSPKNTTFNTTIQYNTRVIQLFILFYIQNTDYNECDPYTYTFRTDNQSPYASPLKPRTLFTTVSFLFIPVSRTELLSSNAREEKRAQCGTSDRTRERHDNEKAVLDVAAVGARLTTGRLRRAPPAPSRVSLVTSRAAGAPVCSVYTYV